MILNIFRRKPSAEARLAATMKPDPEYRKRIWPSFLQSAAPNARRSVRAWRCAMPDLAQITEARRAADCKALNLGGAPKTTWTDDRVDTLLKLIAREFTTGRIASVMGISRSAVSGQISRMKRNAPERLQAVGYEKMSARMFVGSGEIRRTENRKLMDELAEHMANEVSLADAAVVMGITPKRASGLRKRICADLGRQAR